MNRPIEIAVAKDELRRINELLPSPHVLIGGLAVQQYCTARVSKDIDLICDSDTAIRLIQELYPTKDWRSEDKNNDEYRPSYHITHKVDDKGTIMLGPKILERGAYPDIDWEILKRGAKAFIGTSNRILPNILVPAAHTLAYTKFISFLGRVGSEPKTKQDLSDFCNLTNHEEFSIAEFYNLLRRMCDEPRQIAMFEEFRKKSSVYHNVIKDSYLYCLSDLFRTDVEDKKFVNAGLLAQKVCDSIRSYVRMSEFHSSAEFKQKFIDIRDFTCREIDAQNYCSTGEFEMMFDSIFYTIFDEELMGR